MVKGSTPKKITGRIKRFLMEARLNNKPTFLRFTHYDDKYKSGHCLSNCEHASTFYNYSVSFGWIIWEKRNRSFIEAEFHSIIVNNGELLDITPRADNEKSILFVKDNNKKATRLNPQTWRTWTNIISQNSSFRHTQETERQSSISNVI